jgi:glycosyltransferase involved in cell wall biosynthesis
VGLHPIPRRWRWDLRPATRIADLARDGRFDIVHSFLFLPNFYARLARLRHRPPVVISSLRSTGIEGLPRYVAEVLMAPLCDLVIANSEAGRRDLLSRGVAAARVIVVRNGLDLDRFLVLPPPEAPRTAPARIGMVARMAPLRDHDTLVRAFVEVRRRHADARLVLAGDGPLRPRVEALVRSLGLSDAVELPGTVGRPEEVYRSLDLYVQASCGQEGTSNSIVEAMASARPVVATDVGGNTETVVDQVTGRIVAPERPERLAAGILEILDDPRRGVALGTAGRERARTVYTRARMIDASIAVYEEALAAAKRPVTA